MKKTFFLISYLFVQALLASENIKAYTETTISGCNGISVFKPKDEIKTVIKPSSSLETEISVSNDKSYVMVSSKEDVKFIVTTISGENYKVFFSSKSCQMPSKSYEGCFSKKQEIKFENHLETVFYPYVKNQFLVSDNTLLVSNIKEKHKIIYIQEKGQSIKPILLINKCS